MYRSHALDGRCRRQSRPCSSRFTAVSEKTRIARRRLCRRSFTSQRTMTLGRAAELAAPPEAAVAHVLDAGAGVGSARQRLRVSADRSRPTNPLCLGLGALLL